MGGIKHHLQNSGLQANGAQGGNAHFLSRSNQFERDIASKAVNQTPYCRFCGGFIYNSNTDENGHSVNSEWELANSAHFACASKAQAKAKEDARLAMAQEEARRKEAAEKFDWDSYMEEKMKQREEE